jgi:signal peptidase II
MRPCVCVVSSIMSSVSPVPRKVATVVLLPAIAILTLIADQLSKYTIQQAMRPGDFWSPIPFLGRLFRISYVTNTGAAFGLFPDQGGLLVVVAFVVVVIIVAYYRHLPAERWLLHLSLGLQLGGAIGNLLDRVRYGYVVDFIDVGFWPVFNLADSAILIGVAILAYYLWRDEQEGRQVVEERE